MRKRSALEIVLYVGIVSHEVEVVSNWTPKFLLDHTHEVVELRLNESIFVNNNPRDSVPTVCSSSQASDSSLLFTRIAGGPP